MNEFTECPECAAKPDFPSLCPACLANQSTIEKLKDHLNALHLAPLGARMSEAGTGKSCQNCAYYSWKTDSEDGAGKCFRDHWKGPGNTRWMRNDVICDFWKPDPHPPEKDEGTPPEPKRPATRDEILHVSGRTEERLLPDGGSEFKCEHGLWPSKGTCMPCQNAELLREARILREESPVKEPKGTNKAIRKAARKVTRVAQLISPSKHYQVPCDLMDQLFQELKAREERKELG